MSWLHVVTGTATLFAIFFVLSFVYHRMWRTYFTLLECRKQGIPMFPFKPLIGQLSEIRSAWKHVATDSKAGEDDFKFVDLYRRLEKARGPIFALSMGSQPRVNISRPDLVKELLNGSSDDWPKSKFQKQNLTILGNGLVNSNGVFWARQRRMVNPAFSHRNIRNMVSTMVESASSAMDSWQQSYGSCTSPFEVDVSKELSLIALDIIGRSAFGANIGGGSDMAKSISLNLTMYLEAVIATVVGGYLLIPGYRWLPTPMNRKIAQTGSRIREEMRRLIKARKEAHAEGAEGADLLAGLLAAVDDQSNQRMTDQQLIDESVTFLLAGHETTALLMTWAMYLLARNASWQDRLRAEILQVVGPSGEVTAEHLPRLKDLHNVLLESLRLFPPVPAVTRITEKPTRLGEYTVPEGVVVLVPIALLHHKAELWGEDVDEFKPDRFSGGLSQACSEPHCFVPFSAGPRNCVGQMFAMAEAKVVLAHILQRFSWQLSSHYSHSLQMLVTIRPLKGMPMLLTPLRLGDDG